MIKRERIITDGTLIEANPSIESMVSRDPSESDEVEPRTDVTTSLPSKKLSNKTHISKTDPASSLAKKEGTARSLKYKVHISIDAESRVILDNKVTTGCLHETQIYLNRLTYIKDKYNLPILSVIANRGYGSAENIQFLQSQNITTYIPLFSSRSRKVVKLGKSGSIFDENSNEYTCLQGKTLLPRARNTNGTIYKSRSIDCADCIASKECKPI